MAREIQSKLANKKQEMAEFHADRLRQDKLMPRKPSHPIQTVGFDESGMDDEGPGHGSTQHLFGPDEHSIATPTQTPRHTPHVPVQAGSSSAIDPEFDTPDEHDPFEFYSEPLRPKDLPAGYVTPETASDEEDPGPYARPTARSRLQLGQFLSPLATMTDRVKNTVRDEALRRQQQLRDFRQRLEREYYAGPDGNGQIPSHLLNTAAPKPAQPHPPGYLSGPPAQPHPPGYLSGPPTQLSSMPQTVVPIAQAHPALMPPPQHVDPIAQPHHSGPMLDTTSPEHALVRTHWDVPTPGPSFGASRPRTVSFAWPMHSPPQHGGLDIRYNMAARQRAFGQQLPRFQSQSSSSSSSAGPSAPLQLMDQPKAKKHQYFYIQLQRQQQHRHLQRQKHHQKHHHLCVQRQRQVQIQDLTFINTSSNNKVDFQNAEL